MEKNLLGFCSLNESREAIKTQRKILSCIFSSCLCAFVASLPFLVFLVFVATGLKPVSSEAEEHMVDRVVAVVGEEIILLSDI